MAIPQAVAVSRRGPGVLDIISGVCVSGAWFMPWSVMLFRSMALAPALAPLELSPYALARDPAGQFSWVLLLLGLCLVALGFRLALRTRRTYLDGVVQVAVTLALVVVIEHVLSLMGIFAILGDTAERGVFLMPDLGGFFTLIGAGCAVVAYVVVWRRGP